MKILTKEEQQDHYNETLKGGFAGGAIGLVAAAAGVYAGSIRYPMIRHLTLPMKAFLCTSGGTFGAIVTADHFSRAYEAARNADATYKDENERLREELRKQQSGAQRAKDWFREHRYQLVGGSWVASIATAFALVGRNPYLTTQQKIVQARVYAQGFTLLVMVGLAVFEVSDRRKGEGRWETVRVIDPDDPEHKRIIEKQIHHESFEGEDLWRDMVETEERKMKERKKQAHEIEKEHGIREKGKERPKKAGSDQKQKPGNGKGANGDDKSQHTSHANSGKPRPTNQP